MSGPPRTFRFVHPDLEVSEGAGGLRIGPLGRPELVEGDAAVRQAILLLLSTVPGERVMRPDYGCELDRLLFAPNDETTAGLAIHYVRRALDRFEPRIEIVSLDAERAPEDASRLDLRLVYRVRASRREGRLELPLRLTGEEKA